MVAAAGVQKVVAAFAVERAIAPGHEYRQFVIGNFDTYRCCKSSAVQRMHGVRVDEVIHVARAADVEQHNHAVGRKLLLFEGELDAFADTPVATASAPGGGVAGKV